MAEPGIDRRWWKYLWAAPATLPGLLLALLALVGGARCQWVHGVLEVAGGWLDRSASRSTRRFVAITFGHVVLGESTEVLARWRRHEHAHVRQFERLGALMLLLYPLASLWLWLRGGRPYWDNPFEREARAEEDLPESGSGRQPHHQAAREHQADNEKLD